MTREPLPDDGVELRQHFAAAEASLPDIRRAGGHPVYPQAFNDLTAYIVSSPWHDNAYTRFPIAPIFENPETAGADEIAAALTALTRLERFSPGALEGRFKDGTVGRLVERAVSLTRPTVTFAFGGQGINWIKRLAFVNLMHFLAVFLFALGHLAARPEPLEIPPATLRAQAIRDAVEMKRHLEEHPGLTLFGNDFYFQMMHENIVDPSHPSLLAQPVKNLSSLVVTGYGMVFDSQFRILLYLLAVGFGGMCFAALTRWKSRALFLVGMLLMSLAMMPQMTMLFLRENLSHLWWWSLPHLLVTLAMIVLWWWGKGVKA